MNRMNFRLSLLATSFLAFPNDGTALASVYTDETTIPEAVKGFYTKKGERWELNVTIEGVDGVKSFGDFDRLNRALVKERGDHKILRDNVKKLNGRSLDEVVAALDEIEDLKLQLENVDPNNKQLIDEQIEKRLKTRLAPVERERDQLKDKLVKTESTVENFQKQDKRRKIHDQVRDAGTKAKVLPEAIQDALRLSDDIFEIDDSGAILTKDGSDFGVGADPKAWFDELKTKRPHWWAPSSGGGAGGGNNNNNGAVNPWTKANWNLTQQGQIAREDSGRAEKMAQAAGVTVGATRPA